MDTFREAKTSGVILLLALIVAPVPIWLFSADIAEVFNGGGRILQFFAKTSALTGMAAYVLMPILAMRHHLIERLFGSLDHVYELHKNIAKISLVLLALHPLFLASAAIVDNTIGYGVWSWTSIVVWSGVLTFWIMVLLLAFSLYAHVSHKNWVSVHRFFGWLIAPALLHAMLAGKVVANNPVMLTYFLILCTAGFASFLYRSVFGRILVKRYPYEVIEVTPKQGDVVELVLKPSTSISMPYKAGQFAYLTLLSDVVDDEAHPYTISTAPNGPYIRFAIKKLGDYTSHVDEISVGTKALIEGPYGDFTRGINKAQKQVWIAGGIGITPFLSVARSIVDKKNVNIHLFYAMNEIKDAAFLEELFNIKGETEGRFHYTLVTNQYSGRITGEMIDKEIPNMIERQFFICGPPPMMAAIRDQLHALGVPESQIHTEEFSFT